MKCLLAILAVSLAGCCTTPVGMQVQLRDQINMYQADASRAYQAGRMDEYRYLRGVADGVAVAREILEGD
jgi:starvation-inducible outer membrane lipoprotein